MESIQGTGAAFDILPSLSRSCPKSAKPVEQEQENHPAITNLDARKLSQLSNSPDSEVSCPGRNLNCVMKETPLQEGPPIEESASSKDLRSLCLSVNVDRVNTKVNASVSAVKVKANYKGEIIRFGLESNANLFMLKEEMAKRLNLDVGEFEVKYLDDDDEWVSLTCDVDLEECLELSCGDVIRMSIVDFSSSNERGNSQGSQS